MSASRRRALVTGGSGYFGDLLVRRLTATGHEVRVFDLLDTDDRTADVEFIQGDVTDAAAVRDATAGCDVVFHNVAQVPLARDAHQFSEVNVGGTANVLLASEKAGVAKVVYTSSSAVFGVPKVNPVTRSTVPAPLEAYGRAKYEGELLCQAAISRGLDVTIVRPRTILGHGRLGIFGILFEWVADGAAIPVLGPGTNRYQFVHADDLASACLLASSREGPAVYNIGAETFGTMRETLEHLCAYAATGSRVVAVPAAVTERAMRGASAVGLAPFGPYHWLMYGKEMWFDLTPAHEELDWHAQYSVDQMFSQSYDWFLQHRHQAGGIQRSHHRSPARQGALRLVKGVLR